MSDNIEIINGEGAFYAFRDPAWHKLGTITTEAKSANEALEIAKLDWKVQKYPIYTIAPDGTQIEIDGKFATGRVHKEVGFSALGVVGNYYEPVQNIDSFSICDNLMFEGGLGFETAGSLDHGKRVFVSMEVPKQIEIGNNKDAVKLFVMVTNSHDGTSPLTMAVTPVRPVCANTVKLALDKAVSTYKIRHTKNAQGRVEDAKQALGITYNYFDEFSIWANRLYDKEMSRGEYVNFVKALLPKPVETELNKRTIELWDNKFGEIVKLWDAPTQNNIRGTAWAAYNSIVEYEDWFSPIRGKDVDERRAQRIIEGTNTGLKDKAFALLS